MGNTCFDCPLMQLQTVRQPLVNTSSASRNEYVTPKNNFQINNPNINNKSNGSFKQQQDVNTEDNIIKGNTIKFIDYALDKYHHTQNVTKYLNVNGIGKVEIIMYEKGWKENQLEQIIDDISLMATELQKLYPFPLNNKKAPLTDKNQRIKGIHSILKNCYNNRDYYDDDMNETDNNYNNNIINDYIECKSVTKCKALSRITSILKYHSIKSSDVHLQSVFEYFCGIKYGYNGLVSDYHHIVDKHLNNVSITENNVNFREIYKEMSHNISCDIHKCDPYYRNNRNRYRDQRNVDDDDNKYEIENKDPELRFLIDFLDSIHVYFLHSYSNGFKISPDINDNNIVISLTDTELSKVTEYVKEKRKNLCIIPTDNKFVTNPDNSNFSVDHIFGNNTFEQEFEEFIKDNEFDSESIYFDFNKNGKIASKQSNIYEYLTQIDKSQHFDLINSLFCGKKIKYGFGQRFYYWPHFKYHPWFVKGKYTDLKTEIVSKGISMQQWQDICNQAKKLLPSSTLKRIKSTYVPGFTSSGNRSDEYYYNLDLFSPIRLQHLMSLLFYTNNTLLCFRFSRTFRRLYSTEDDKSFKKRNSKWVNMSRLLRELIECYGDKIQDSKQKIFYHGMSLVYFSRFDTSFYGPTSTTNSIATASIFSPHNGLILELQESTNVHDGLLRYFNCNLVSCYKNEEERLFFGGQYTIGFKSITLLKEKQNLEYYVKTLQHFNQIINGNTPWKMSKDEMMRIKKLINKTSQNQFPQYVLDSFSLFCNEKEIITLNIAKLYEFSKELILYFTSADVANLLKFNFIISIFTNLKTIYCEMTDFYVDDCVDWIIGEKYINGLINEIKEINQNKQIKLQKIYIKTDKYEDGINPDIDLHSERFKSLNWNIYKNQHELSIIRND